MEHTLRMLQKAPLTLRVMQTVSTCPVQRLMRPTCRDNSVERLCRQSANGYIEKFEHWMLAQ